jgi:hypothetical protein
MFQQHRPVSLYFNRPSGPSGFPHQEHQQRGRHQPRKQQGGAKPELQAEQVAGRPYHPGANHPADPGEGEEQPQNRALVFGVLVRDSRRHRREDDGQEQACSSGRKKNISSGPKTPRAILTKAASEAIKHHSSGSRPARQRNCRGSARPSSGQNRAESIWVLKPTARPFAGLQEFDNPRSDAEFGGNINGDQEVVPDAICP